MQGKVAVIGAGVMGTGIATLATGRGIAVVLVDVDPAALERAAAAVPAQFRMGQLYGKFPRDAVAADVRCTTELSEVADAEIVVEAIVEITQAKAALLAELSTVTGPQTVLVSNTSAMPIDELAGYTKYPGQVVGAHFMNPPYLIRTVEVIRGRRTAPQTLTRLGEMLDAFGCEAIVVNDGPGFVINRVLQRMINESARIVGEGIATPSEVDRLFQGCLGHTTGPLATADLIGLDNVVDSLRVLHDRTGDAGYEPCDELIRMVGRGDLGRKTRRGFHSY